MSRSIVLDCSVTAAWFLNEESSGAAVQVLEDLNHRVITVLVPALWWYEIANVLRTAVKRKRIEQPDAYKSLFLLKELPIETVAPAQQGQSEMLRLALEHDISLYDASYLQLALLSGAELITDDNDLLKLRKVHPSIKSLNQY